MWTTSLPAARAEQLVAQTEDAGRSRPCRTDESPQLVVLRVTGEDPFGNAPIHRDFVVRPNGCVSLQLWRPQGGSWVRLTPANVRPWAVEGVRTYVWHNGLPRPLDRFFRSMWG
jgi:hypothetical protein